MAIIRDRTLNWEDFASDPLWLIPCSPLSLTSVSSSDFFDKPDVVGTHQFGITSMIQNEVFWFEVPINDPFGMQIGKSFDHTCCVKPGC